MNTGGTELWLLLLGALILVALLVLVAVLVLRGAMKKGPAELIAPALPQGLSVTKETAVATSFQSALAVLRERVVGNSFQYRVPWVLMIGPPGSGKTSILDGLSSGALQDPGTQTRSGEIAWGFLNKGVVIDVPGSLLLGPAAGVQSDESAWEQMLHRLNRHRPARPLDGVVLTFSAAELLDTNADIGAKGALIRAKLDELQSAVGLVLPVYVVVTKCDTVPGFGSFCREINQRDPDQKKEIFGWSNDHNLESVFTWVWVDEALATLHRRLREHQLRFFGTPKPLASADELFVFPPEFQTLRDPLRNLLTQLFIPVSYRDSHYFRGVYFCGLPQEPGTSSTGLELVAANADGRNRSPLFFLENLFDRKIFVEKTLARPVAQRFAFRNHIVMGAQIFAVAFSVIMALGLGVDYFRLSRARDRRIAPAIDRISQSMSADNTEDTIDPAFNLVETFAWLHSNGLKSLFMPSSWNDPIDEKIQLQLERGFRDLVLKPAEVLLEKDYKVLAMPQTIGDSATGPVDCSAPIGGTGANWLTPADNPSYQALRRYLGRLVALEREIQMYERLSRSGSGSVQDVLNLLQDLSGKKLPAASNYENNPYFARAIQGSEWKDVDVSSSRKLAAVQTQTLLEKFFREWFPESILLRRVGCVRDDLQAFEQSRRQTVPELREIAERIAELDQIFAGSSLGWLEKPISVQSEPVLNQLAALKPVFGDSFDEFKAKIETDAQENWQQLRSLLLDEETPLAGPMLERASGTQIHLASKVQTLGTNLEYLASLDFMASAGTQALTAAPATPIFWNADLLHDALKMNESWEKYQHDVLPTIPAGLQGPIKAVAQHNLVGVMTDLATRARTPLPSNRTDDALVAELKNFNQTLDVRKQLQEIAEKARPAGTPLITTLSLYAQAVRLLGAVNTRLSTDAFYSFDSTGLKSWEGTPALSLALYKAESPDALSDAITVDHERLRTLVESAAPLVALLSDQGLPVGDARQTVYWGKLGADFKQFGDKKPGNPVASLESFLRLDVDKITPENHCQGGAADPRTTDPFINSLNSLRTDAVRACLGLVRQRYNMLAANFQQHLAGRFPFSADRTSAVEADPDAVNAFFAMYDQGGASFSESLEKLATLDSSYRSSAQQAVSFLKAVARVRPLFATADSSSLPVLDVTPQFRTNQSREAGGNQIIDWELRIADQVYPFQVPAKPVRWHYGDPVTLTLRYAKDSPRVPVAKVADSNVQVGDRRVTYDYRSNWSLFALLVGRAASPSDFDNPLAPPPNTIRLNFGNAPGSPGQASAQKPPDTTVFVTFNLQAPAAKDVPPKEGAAKNSVVVSDFPVSAPTVAETQMITGGSK